MNQKITRNLGIVLVAIEGQYRSTQLYQRTLASGLPFIEIHATTPQTSQLLKVNRPLLQLLRIGRKLSDREISTFESHRRAQTSEFAKGNSWTVILEDDAEVSDSFFEYLKSLEKVYLESPSHVNFLHSPRKILSSEESELISELFVKKTRYLYAGAVAYAINASAQRILSSNMFLHVTTPSDYPAIFNVFQKFIIDTSQNLVSHRSEVKSTIYPNNQVPKNNKLLLFLGHISGFTYIACKPDYLNVQNYLDLEIRQRLVRRFFR